MAKRKLGRFITQKCKTMETTKPNKRIFEKINSRFPSFALICRTNLVKYPVGIRHQHSNSLPLDRESLPLTTRPGPVPLNLTDL